MKSDLMQNPKLLTMMLILGVYLFWFLFPSLFIGIKGGFIVSAVMGTFYAIRILWDLWIKSI